jgi:SAM-dependent methyltransferase/acyl carrier protein
VAQVDLTELDAVLAGHPDVAQACAVSWIGPDGDTRLVAYVAPSRRRPAGVGEPGGGEPGAGEPGAGEPSAGEQVRQWRLAYDELFYAGLDDTPDPTFNTHGWFSSYTGQPIPDAEMREQVDQAVARILAGRPRRILEIGCGTGMLMFRLVGDGQCEQYTGTDFSGTALDYVRAALADRPLSAQVRLIQAEAPDLSALASDYFDIVVLNSVVQHFPSADYLRMVLDQAIALVPDGGRVFLGDLRSRALLPLFHTSVHWQRTAAGMPARTFAQIVSQKTADEHELALDPGFFTAAGLARVVGVRTELKRGISHNELTRFRYDVVLDIGTSRPGGGDADSASSADSAGGDADSVGGDAAGVPLDLVLRWGDEVCTVEQLRLLAGQRRPRTLRLTGVVNRRCAVDRWVLRQLAQAGPDLTMGRLRDSIPADVDAGSADPEELWRLADSLSYQVEIGWSAGEPADGGPADGSFDATFRRAPGPIVVADAPWRSYANDPLAALSRAQLARELRAYLENAVPAYLVPASVMVLESLPLTDAGAIDLAKLPPPGRLTDEPPWRLRHDEPSARDSGSQTRRLIAGMWRELLGTDAVGDESDFFDAGGNSLAAIQLAARMSEAFGIPVAPLAIFECPTLAGLTALMEATSGIRS